MNILGGILGGIKELALAGKETWAGYQYAKKHKFVTCLYFEGSDMYEFKAVKTPDNRWISPKDVNQQMRIDGELPLKEGRLKIQSSFTRYPYGDTVYVMSKGCPHTIDPTKWDINLDDVKRGEILSSIAYDLFRTSIFKYMMAPSKRETMLLVIAFSLFFLIVGFSFGMSMGVQ